MNEGYGKLKNVVININLSTFIIYKNGPSIIISLPISLECLDGINIWETNKKKVY